MTRNSNTRPYWLNSRASQRKSTTRAGETPWREIWREGTGSNRWKRGCQVAGGRSLNEQMGVYYHNLSYIAYIYPGHIWHFLRAVMQEENRDSKAWKISVSDSQYLGS